MARGNRPVEVRVDDATRDRWEAAARDAGMNLSAWIRETVDCALDEPVAGALIAMQAEDNARASTRRRPAKGKPSTTVECSRARHHRSGTFCKECGTVPS